MVKKVIVVTLINNHILSTYEAEVLFIRLSLRTKYDTQCNDVDGEEGNRSND